MQGLWFLPSIIFGVIQGVSAGNWQMLLFALLSASVWPVGLWLRKTRDFALDGEVTFDGKDVWIGKNRLPRREVLWKKAWHQVLWDGLRVAEIRQSLPERLRAVRAHGFRGTTNHASWLGVENGRDFEFDLPDAGPHLLIVGATGTGKSEMLRLLITSWLAQGEAAELALIDFKGGATFSRFAKHPGVIACVTDLESEAAPALTAQLEEQLMSRQLKFAGANVGNIDEYRSRGFALKRQILVIDELGELLRQNPRLVQALEQIASRGRSLGMHLVVANQSVSGISRALLVNLRARMVIGEMDPIDFSQLGFRGRGVQQYSMPGWRHARLRNGHGFEFDFQFPVGF